MHKPFNPVTHQVGAGAFHQMNERQLVLQRDLLHAQNLLQPHGLDGARFNTRVAGHHHAAHTFDKTDARHHTATRDGLCGVFVVLHETRKRAERQIGRARIKQQTHPLARQQLATFVEHGTGFGGCLRGARFKAAQHRDAL